MSQVLGNAIAYSGIMNAIGFERSAEVVIRSAGIQPWPAKTMIRGCLEHQVRLARSSPLRTIPVRYGLDHFSRHIGRFHGLSKKAFVEVAKNLIEVRRIPLRPHEAESLEAIFDSMDYSKNGELEVGEWASGLTVFFKGAQEEKTAALFQLLDRSNHGHLSKPEIKEYVTPLVKAMTPSEAAGLRPLLISHTTDTIFNQVDMNHDGKCDSNEFKAWLKDHDVVNELANVIEGEIYKIWAKPSSFRFPMDLSMYM